MDSDRQYNSTAVWMCLSWVVAITLIVVGTVIGVSWAQSAQARMAATCILAFGFLFVAAAVCMTVRLMLRDQTRHLLGVMETQRDISRLHNGRMVSQ